jgi:hypothetical protein
MTFVFGPSQPELFDALHQRIALCCAFCRHWRGIALGEHFAVVVGLNDGLVYASSAAQRSGFGVVYAA